MKVSITAGGNGMWIRKSSLPMAPHTLLKVISPMVVLPRLKIPGLIFGTAISSCGVN